MYFTVLCFHGNGNVGTNAIHLQVHPQNEEYWGNVNPIGPRACYDEGKRVAETMVYNYARQVGVQNYIPRCLKQLPALSCAVNKAPPPQITCT